MVQQIKAHRILEAVVHTSGVRAPIDCIDLLAREQPVLLQKVEVDEIRVARAGAEALIGAVAVAGRADGQDLPVALTGMVQEIGKVIGGFAQRADAIGRGQRRNVH